MIHWLDETHFEIDGLRFCLDVSRDRPLADSGAEIVLMKPRADLVNAYVDALARYRNCNVVEFGVWGGGSTILYERLMKPRKLVAIELETDVPKTLEHYIAENDLGGTIVPCYGVDQGDPDALREIMKREFQGEPVDVVIDDASHRYAPTKSAFNELFPLLRAGGTYFLEDWGWAHWRGRFQEHWNNEPALTNLVFELSMVLATWGGYMISRVDIQHGFVAVERGTGKVPARFDVSSLFLSRGRNFQHI
jgi:predicted O-methyltransferase YrrM